QLLICEPTSPCISEIDGVLEKKKKKSFRKSNDEKKRKEEQQQEPRQLSQFWNVPETKSNKTASKGFFRNQQLQQQQRNQAERSIPSLCITAPMEYVPPELPTPSTIGSGSNSGSGSGLYTPPYSPSYNQSMAMMMPPLSPSKSKRMPAFPVPQSPNSDKTLLQQYNYGRDDDQILNHSPKVKKPGPIMTNQVATTKSPLSPLTPMTPVHMPYRGQNGKSCSDEGYFSAVELMYHPRY
ncbi:hypothetical protein BGX28_008339, partial [Mortierella sp. GBA30]